MIRPYVGIAPIPFLPSRASAGQVSNGFSGQPNSSRMAALAELLGTFPAQSAQGLHGERTRYDACDAS